MQKTLHFLKILLSFSFLALLLAGCEPPSLPPTGTAGPKALPTGTGLPTLTREPAPTRNGLPILTNQPADLSRLADFPILDPANLDQLTYLGVQDLDPAGKELNFQLYDWTGDGRSLVACVDQRGTSSFQVFDLDRGTRQAEIEIEEGICQEASRDENWLKFSPNGSLFLGGMTRKCVFPMLNSGASCTPALFDSTTGEQLSILKEPPEGFPGEAAVLQSASFSPTGDTLAAAVEYPPRPASTADAAVEGGAWTPDRYGIELYQVETGAHRETYQKLEAWVILDLAYSPSGERLLVATFDSVEAWQIPGSKTNQVPCPRGEISFSPTAEIAALSCRPSEGEKYQLLWDPASGEITELSGAPSPDYQQLRFSSDGRLLMGLSNTKQVSLWDGANGEHLYTLPYTFRTALDVHFSGDGRLITVLNPGGRLQLFGVK